MTATTPTRAAHHDPDHDPDHAAISEAIHLRAVALRTVVRSVEDGGPLPWGPEQAAVFADRADLLVALHECWSRQLLARVDVALEVGQGTQQESIARAWRSAVEARPGVRRVLDAERDNPALQPARRSLLAAVAVAAGLATLDDPRPRAAALGAAFLDRVDATASTDGPSLVRRVLRRLWDGTPVRGDAWSWAA